MRPYGSGTVERFRGRFRARGAPLHDGRRPVLGTFDTFEDASTAADGHAIVTAGAGLAAGTMTLRAWGIRYLARREAAGKRNIYTDKCRWRLHIDTAHFADWPLPTITRREIKEWLRRLASTVAADTRAKDPEKRRAVYLRKPRKIGPQTRKHCLNLLRKALAEALDDEMIVTNPAAGIEPPKVGASEFDWLSLAEQNAIERCALIDEADRLRAMFAWGTGMRQFDQWTLKLSDVRNLDGDAPDVYFWCHKLHRRTRIPLFGAALRAIKRWLQLLPAYCEENERGLVFPLPSGAQRGRSKTYGWPEMLQAAGIKRHVTWHELRDTCASSLVSGIWGRPWRLEEVKEMLGHSSVEVTERYAHLAPAVLDGAARATIGHQSAIVEPPVKKRSTAKNKGRARQDSNLLPSASEATGKSCLCARLGLEDGYLVADAEGLLRAQASGDHTTAFRLGLDLATAIVEASRALAAGSERRTA